MNLERFSRTRTHLGALAALLISTSAAQVVRGPYDELTNVYRTVTNFNVETTRGMAAAADGTFVFINTHGSLLAFHRPGGVPLVPDDIHPTANNPIALDLWYDLHGGDVYVAVLGGTTHALVLHDFVTGRIRSSVPMLAETGDVVVDNELACAFVSCPGNNTVVQVDLATALLNDPTQDPVVATFTVASQRPRFLSLDPGKKGKDDNVVFVAPELSGNNTVTSVTAGLLPQLTAPFNTAFTLPFFPWTVIQNALALGGSGLPVSTVTTNLAFNARAIDLDSFAAITNGLPDEDLFRLDPVRLGGAAVKLPAVPVLRGAGTVLAAHGRNPANGDYWIVGTDAQNADLMRQTEPLLNGNFAFNQVAIATALGAGGGVPPKPTAVVDLDLTPSGGYGAPFSLASPYALEFDPAGRFVAIAGATADRVRFADNGGRRLGDLELPAGTIPRDLMLDASGTILFVYCWGTNEVRLFNAPALLAAFPGATNNVIVNAGLPIDLGVDPTPEPVKRGRTLFYDAQNSANARFTCNTCHPGGGTDIIGWSIKDFPHDHKDLMVTQSLKGIEDTFPYHWRGERDLAQFNVAFEGLLGGAKLDSTPGGELDDFIAFVFSMQSHANPRQSPLRELDSSRATALSFFPVSAGGAAGTSPNPVAGQADMDVPATLFGSFSCADCHQKVHGTVADINLDDPISGTFAPTNAAMDVAHFRQLFHRTQDIVDVDVAGVTVPMVRGGYGLTHDGNQSSPLDFIADPANTFDLSNVRAVDLAAFIEQADQGIAPAVHRAWFLDATSLPALVSELQLELFAQVGTPFEQDHWVSVAGIGTHVDRAGAVHDLRWFYYPPTGLFHANDPSVVFPDGAVGVQSAFALINEIMAGNATMLLMGIAPGNAIRFSVDRDDDGLDDATELANNFDPLDPDTDGDGDEDGHEHLNPGGDTTPPQLLWWRVDHETASTIKVVYFLSEPARVTFTATDLNTGRTVQEQRFVESLYDTVVIQHLDPSLPSLTLDPQHTAFPPSLQGIQTRYQLSVQLTDLAGLSPAAPIVLNPVNQPIATKDQLVVQPFFLAPNSNTPAQLARVIAARQWNPTANPGHDFDATFTVKERYDTPALDAVYATNGAAINGYSSPNEGQVVVTQVLVRPTPSSPWQTLDIANPATPTVLGINQDPNAVFATVASFGTPDLAGAFVISAESDNAGDATLTFSLNNPLPAGATLSLNVLGIFERDNRNPAPVPNIFWPPSLLSYQGPATAEQNRSLVYP
jgi:hypothetical protein